MAKDFSNAPTMQKKLFGPFNGLNGTQSPFLRELPPAANAAPREFATEFQNLVIDQKTQEMVSRFGMEHVEGAKADPSTLQIAGTAGLFKWIDYDALTGQGRERALNLCVDEFGTPTVRAYRLIKTQVRITSNTLNGKSFAIIEDSAASYAKRVVIYNADGTVFASYSDINTVPNISINYVDYVSSRDGNLIAGAIDLIAPTVLTYSASNGTPTSVAEFYSLAKRTTLNGDLNLSAWVQTLSTSTATYFTAAQASNVMYFSGGGVCPILKYDGQNIFKAGMPHAAIHGEMAINTPTVSAFSSTYNENVNAVFEGLMNPSTAPNQSPLGKFIWLQTYEHGDAKNNFIEGAPYLPGSYYAQDSTGAPVLGVNIKPKYRSLTETLNTAGVISGTVYQPLPNSLVPADGYDARGLLLLPKTATYTQSAFVVTVTQANHNKVVGQRIYVDMLTGTGVDGYYTIATTPTVNTFTYTAGTSLATAGNMYVTREFRTADVATSITLVGDGTNNTLKNGDFVCIRAVLLTDTPASDSKYRFPILITARVSTTTTPFAPGVNIDTTYPITVEVIPGGDLRANALDGLLSNLTTNTQQALISRLSTITTWQALLAWDWLGLSTFSKVLIWSDWAVSNNLRLNIYRNKANANEANAYDPNATDGNYIPNFYLQNIVPNNPFSATTSIGPQYDNCKDACLGALLVERVPLQVGDQGLVPFVATTYSSLPKGCAISSFKGRLYLCKDLTNQNTLWRSDLVYGTEYFTADDALNMETPAGDDCVIAIGNDEAIFVLKDNSVKVILNDFTNTNIRIDDLVIGDYGCTSAATACQLESGVAYLTAKGVVWIQANKEIKYLGENSNGISRIKDRINEPNLDLFRASAAVDTVKGQYKLFIPKITKAGVGLYNPTDTRNATNPYYNDDGVMLIYDYNNDAWFEHTGINAKGGMVIFSEETDRFFALCAYAKNTSESLSTLEWALYKERNYGNLWSYADRLERNSVEELRAISLVYGTDWLAMDDANGLKQFLRCKVYALQSNAAMSYRNTAGTIVTLSNSYSLTITGYKDWRDNNIHSQSTVTLTPTNLYDYMKCRNNKASVMKFLLTHNTLFSSPRIQAMEVEAVVPFKGRMRPWSTP